MPRSMSHRVCSKFQVGEQKLEAPLAVPSLKPIRPLHSLA